MTPSPIRSIGLADGTHETSLVSRSGDDVRQPLSTKRQSATDPVLGSLASIGQLKLDPRGARKPRVLKQNATGAMPPTVYCENNSLLMIRGNNGLFNPVPPSHAVQFQSEQTIALEFTEKGLDNLRKKYEEVHGAPPFLHSLLNLEKSNEHVYQIAKTPEFYPYFDKEKFLVVNNVRYDTGFESQKFPKRAKVKPSGITLCAWFIHPGLNCINDESRRLLADLSFDAMPKDEKSRLVSLKNYYSKNDFQAPQKKAKIRDSKTIGQLKQDGEEYLASILDLNVSHIEMLKNLKAKTMLHLEQTYGVGASDDIAMYFHFPYPKRTTM